MDGQEFSEDRPGAPAAPLRTARRGAGGGPVGPAAPVRFAVGPGYALYRGPLADSAFHRHATFQVALACGPARRLAVDDADGRRHRGPAIVVAPMVRHRMAPTREVLVFYVDPHCAFADRLRADCAQPVAVAPQWCGLTEREVRPGGGRPAAGLDPRLRAAMAALADEQVPLEGLAARVGLSPQRLRALAQRQLGVPLARWRSWQRLARAAVALGEGCSPAQAALAGGFADQAHFSRWMRESTGLTPAQVLPALRGAAAGQAERDAIQAGRREAPAERGAVQAGRRAV
ncbi:helix-turn-helix domain-containing protein [Kitasatospora sp. NPDC018619]|uniref:helix-turn-helix domain-containing protein n=1 Tax=unclassified Kitasatospora TaxID=2633591 RepID=UPI003797DA90